MSYKPANPPATLDPRVARYLTDELNRIATEFGSLEGGSPGPTFARNYVYSTVNGTFPFRNILTIFTTTATLTMVATSPVKLEIFIPCTRQLRIRLLRSLNGGAFQLFADQTNIGSTTGNRGKVLDWVDTVPAAGDTVAYQIQTQTDIDSTEQTDATIWVEEA